ncbi:hypothetical protein EW026_g1146 [Hermanssonia centrifuga]|uniref:Uncharacterized protein n=1 Tax=Hermanssonia centrifuga TaxID=98765 RepID=A0A4S4KWX7_9APHY|nr:hypothetical protein EW026_g1146 [Hermanssonia centrifuga]
MEYYEDIPLDQSIFPEPPWSPDCGLEFTLTRSVLIRAHRERFGLGGELVAHLTGFNFGLARSHDTSDLLQVESRKRIWMPISADGKSKMGSWKQRVEFKTSTFTLRCPPSLRSDTMNIAVRHYTPAWEKSAYEGGIQHAGTQPGTRSPIAYRDRYRRGRIIIMYSCS